MSINDKLSNEKRREEEEKIDKNKKRGREANYGDKDIWPKD